MTITLPEFVEIDGLALATGVADGPSLVSKLGSRGNRDVVVVGSGVRRAERIQRNLDGGEVGIDGATRELLPDDVAELFSEWCVSAQAHVAGDLTVNTVEYALTAESYDAGAPRHVTGTAAKVLIDATVAGVGLGAASVAAHQNGNVRGSGHAGGEIVVPRRRWAG